MVGVASFFIKHSANLFTDRLVLAKYDVKQRAFKESNSKAVGEQQHDIYFHPEDCREELEVSFHQKFTVNVRKLL